MSDTPKRKTYVIVAGRLMEVDPHKQPSDKPDSTIEELQMETDQAFEELTDKLENILKALEGKSEWFNFCGYMSRKFKDLSKQFWDIDRTW